MVFSPQKGSSGAASATGENPLPARRGQRSDGAEARGHLLHTALQLFSERGYSKTSTREIAKAAQVNIAAISYYFGDKAGLYRAAFLEPFGNPGDPVGLYSDPLLTLNEALQGFFTGFFEPLKQGERMQHCMRLHFREMLEPTGAWAEGIDNGIRPAHLALVEVLRRHLALPEADDALHRLAFCVAGLGVQMYASRDVVQALRPQLLGEPALIDVWAKQVVVYAAAIVEAERTRRASACASTATPPHPPQAASNIADAAENPKPPQHPYKAP